MARLRVAELKSRAVLHVTGDDAASFLDRLITSDIDPLVDAGPGAAAYGALLSPQGKILTDFLVVRETDGFLIDLPAAAAADLAKRLTLYKLRAKVAVEDVSDRLAVLAIWDGGEAPAIPGRLVRDPRHPALGFRAYVADVAIGAAEAFPGSEIEPEATYQEHRAALGIPEAGMDFQFGDAFPHEIAMDQLSGVAFDKGCYVGQEVVSRMQHRGTARRRPVLVAADTTLPVSGTEILAGGKAAGTLGSAVGGTGLAVVRLDRVKDAMDAGAPITAGDVPIRLSLPGWAGYTWPAGPESD